MKTEMELYWGSPVHSFIPAQKPGHNEADPNFIVYFLAFENLGNAALPASVPAWVHSLTTNKAFLFGASIMELNF